MGSPAKTAHAAAITTIVPTQINNALVGSAAANGTLLTYTTVSALTNTGGDIIHVTFPTGTNISGLTAAKVTVLATGGAATAPTSLTVSGTRVSMTLAAATTDAPAIGNVVTIALTGTDGTEIRFPTTPTTTGTLKVEQDNGGNGTINDEGELTNIAIRNVAFTVSPTSIPADGLSTSTVTLNNNSGGTILTNGATFSVTTSAGQFVQKTGLAANNPLTAMSPDPAVSAVQTVSGVAGSPINDTTSTTVTLRAPSTAGSAVVRLYVTPHGGGTAQLVSTTTVTLTTPAASAGPVASASISPTTISATQSATTGTITVTLADANGNAPIAGESFTVSSTLGIIASAGGAFAGASGVNSQQISGSLAGGATGTITVTGQGVPGTSTITFTRGAVTTTSTVTFTGPAASIALSMRHDESATSTANMVAGATHPNNGTQSLRLRTILTDAAGNRIGGVTPNITVSGSGVTVTAAASGTSGATLGISDSTVTIAAGEAVGSTRTFTVSTTGANNVTISETISITLGGTGTPATLEIDAPAVGVAGNATITVTASNADGIPMQDGTIVTLVASAGAVVNNSIRTTGGKATFTYVAPGTAQAVNITAVSGTRTTSTALSVGGAAVPAPAPTPGDGSLTAPTFGTGNVGSAIFAGGTIEQLAAQVTAAGGIGVWIQDDNGIWRAYLVAGPAVVNTGFNTAFAGGFATAVPVFVVK